MKTRNAIQTNKTNAANEATMKQLGNLIEAAHSPFHCCSYLKDRLGREGFTQLFLNQPFSVKKGGKYMIQAFDGTLLAITIGQNISDRVLPKIRMITSHTDWPSFLIKPNPDLSADGYLRLNTEPYGGAVYHTWIDRPLGIAGKVCLRTNDPLAPSCRLFDSGRPVVIIPGLAIHMDREINSALKLNPQTQLLPLFSLTQTESETGSHPDFLSYLAGELSCRKEDILDYELFLYNCDLPETVGLQKEFVSAPRIDNCSGVLAALSAICEADTDKDTICVSAFYHNEEIGNDTKQGAGSAVTEQILSRIFAGLSYSREDLSCCLFDGLCLSLDVAHALHPAYTDKNDPTNRLGLGSGVCLKLSARQSYATDSTYVSMIQGLCDAYHIPYGKFVNRSDQRGGSTLGTVVSTSLSMPCVDAGVWLLSMHSARELIALCDQTALCTLSQKLFATESASDRT